MKSSEPDAVREQDVASSFKSSFVHFNRKAKRFILRSGPAQSYHSLPRKDAFEPMKIAGWQKGARLCLLGALISLLAEAALLTVLLKLDGTAQGPNVVFSGDCKKAKSINLALVTLLNIVGTTLVGTSSYVMQCLNAPSRREVDKAHANGRYLNVGVPSVNNFRYLSVTKLCTWSIMLFSTIPIHLLLNSVVFASLQSNNYGVLLVSPDFLDDPSWDLCSGPTLSTTAQFSCGAYLTAKKGDSNLSRKEPRECIQHYSGAIDNLVSNVLLVTKNATKQDRWSLSTAPTTDSDSFSTCNVTCLDKTGRLLQESLLLEPSDSLWNVSTLLGVWNSLDYTLLTRLQYAHFNTTDPRVKHSNLWNPQSWLCDTGRDTAFHNCDATGVLKDSDHWRVTPNSIEIDFCLVETVQRQVCKVHYNVILLSIVMGCDLLKICCIAYVSLAHIRRRTCRKDMELITLGDAIESFLDEPDETSVARSLVDQKHIRSLQGSVLNWAYDEDFFELMPLEQRVSESARVFGPQPLSFEKGIGKRKAEAASFSRWGLSGTIFALLLIGTLLVLSLGLVHLKQLGISTLFTQGLGIVDPNSAFTPEILGPNDVNKVIRTILLVNTPQLFLSMLYFVYNGLLTRMMCVIEFGKFCQRPTTLRVSIPSAEQRSTYWLSLPWKASLPSLLLSVALHWLASRSLFQVEIEVLDWNGQLQPDRNVSACGFSTLAILLVAVVLLVMLSVLVGLGYTSAQPGIPIVGTNSWAISAACHDVCGDKDAARKPLMWGEISYDENSRIGHCSLSSRPVSAPVQGRTYA